MRGRGSALLDILSLPRIDRDPDAPDLLSIRSTELLTHLQAGIMVCVIRTARMNSERIFC